MMRVTRREFAVRTWWGVGDALIAAGSAVLAAWLRFDLNIARTLTSEIGVFAALFGGAVLIVSLVFMLFSRSHHRGTFEETAQVARNLVIASFVAALAVFVVPLTTLPEVWHVVVPRSVPLVAPVLALLGMFTLRFVVRAWRASVIPAREDDKQVIIYGAGLGGKQLVRALLRDEAPGPRLVPVAIIDDDPGKRRWRIEGVRVRGGASHLAKTVEETGATVLAVAIPSISPERLSAIRELAVENDLELLVLPSAAGLLGAAPTGSDLRSLKLEDLLGRRPIQLNTAEIAAHLTGKRVLVTGAGGSIGSELCRQIRRFGPSKLVLLDRDESALHGAQMSMTGRALLDDGTLALTDIRDLSALKEIFDREQPEVVFHAAALKHLTLLEQYPAEAWKTNILGTLNVLEAAHCAGVQTFVNISTDKAADPTCVLGYSKRVAERLTADYAGRKGATYVSVRFGNVLGSRGSVLTAFTAQIENGGPVTVTHPEVERYFMLIPEACQLVLQAAAIGRNGEVMVLDMGEPVKIYDVAKTLIGMSGRKDVEIDFTGLRPGEKLSEVLFAPGEDIRASDHPLVRHVQVPGIDASSVEGSTFLDAEESRDWMRRESTTSSELATVSHINDRLDSPNPMIKQTASEATR